MSAGGHTPHPTPVGHDARLQNAAELREKIAYEMQILKEQPQRALTKARNVALVAIVVALAFAIAFIVMFVIVFQGR